MLDIGDDVVDLVPELVMVEVEVVVQLDNIDSHFEEEQLEDIVVLAVVLELALVVVQ